MCYSVDSYHDAPMEDIKILTDDVEIELMLDFENFGENIVKMIRGTQPKFSVGIYGDWGTGKTRLMKLINERLLTQDNKQDNNSLTIWFNAYTYERDQQFVL